MSANGLPTASFHIPREEIDRYLDWQECAAFKFEYVNAGTVVLRIARDLEAITRPDGDDRAAS